MVHSISYTIKTSTIYKACTVLMPFSELVICSHPYNYILYVYIFIYILYIYIICDESIFNMLSVPTTCCPNWNHPLIQQFDKLQVGLKKTRVLLFRTESQIRKTWWIQDPSCRGWFLGCNKFSDPKIHWLTSC